MVGIRNLLTRIKLAAKAGIAQFRYPLYSQPWKHEFLQFNDFSHYHTCFARLMGRETYEALCPIMWRGAGKLDDPRYMGCGNCEECDNCRYAITVNYVFKDNDENIEITVDDKILYGTFLPRND